jgi:multiple sugar transport system permease protein
VILPLLRPSLQVALILRTILAFQVFAVVLALAGRGMSVLASEAYRWYNAYRNPNVAAAYAALIMLLSIATTVLYLRALYTREEAMQL